MIARRLARFVRNHCRVAVVWAMLPLVMLNGHTLTGCGCTGHFEAVCHCHCGTGCCSMCGQGGTCSCCTNKSLACRASERSAPRNDQQGVQGHRCTQIVVYVMVPATVTPAAVAHNSYTPALTLAALDLPLAPVLTSAGQIVQLDAGPPPNDLVITLQRLVI